MGNRLYQKPFRNWSDARANVIVQRVSRASIDELSDEKLNGVVNHAVNHPELRVPQLKEEDKHGKRINDSTIDVHIPFEGSALLFEVEPTEHSVVTETVYVNGRELVFRVRDDDSLEKNLESMIATIRNNLASLDRDIGRYRLRINEDIMTAAGTRRAELNAVAARDRSRSFPIR